MLIKCPKCQNMNDSELLPEAEGRCLQCGNPLAGDLSGGCIDEFQVLAELGRGNNGAVFLALQHGTGREVALKLLREEALAESDGVANFFKEARAVAKLNHPHIVQAIAAGRLESGNFYLAMELVDGPSVEDLVDEEGIMGYHDVLRIGAEIAGAMAYAWNTKGLIHGDIKPANIILHNRTTAKLADLGLAQFGRVSPYEIMATPLYAPPEVIRGEFDNMSFWSDIYSFGATLYEMFCDSPPFPGTDINLVLKMQLEQEPETLVSKLGLFDVEVSNMVNFMLAKQPENRPPSWDFVADFLAYKCEQV